MDTTKSGEYEKPISKAILITGKFYGKKKRKLCQTHFFFKFYSSYLHTRMSFHVDMNRLLIIFYFKSKSTGTCNTEHY